MEQFKQNQEHPKISQEYLDRYTAEIDTILRNEVILASRGYEEGVDLYKPWSVDDIKGFTDSILIFLDQKVKLYVRAGQTDEAQIIGEKIAAAKDVFSELNSTDSVPEGFIEKLKEVI